MLGLPAVESGESMKKVSKSPSARRKATRRVPKDEMRAEYDFSSGVRGKYAKAYAEGTNLVLLEPDVAAEFKSSRAVNRALRDYLKRRPR
jgi:hypothetical protein